MKLSSFLFSAAVAALPQEPPIFDIAVLSVGATPHSSSGIYHFLLANGQRVIHTSCDASRQTYNLIVNVTLEKCQNTDYSWNWTVKADGSSEISLWFFGDKDEVMYGLHQIPKDQIIWTNQQSPNGGVQVYNGPKNFTVTGGSE